MQTLQEAYKEIYYNEDDLYQDIVEFCENLNIFDSIEEAEYFSNLIIENDLSKTFVEDVLEYYAEEELLDESYIAEVSAGAIKAGLKLAGGILKKATAATRGLPAKTLAKKGITPGGFGSKGKILNPQARTLQTRAIRQARAARKPPEAPKANRYADMLAQKKASQAASAPASAASKPSGGMKPSYVAKRGITDTLATALTLGMGHMAGLKPATNVLRQMAQPIVRTVQSTTARQAPNVARKVTGAAADPWMKFPKINKPKQLGLPKEGPSSRLPNRTLTGTPEPKGLLPAAKPTPTRSARKVTGAAADVWKQFPKINKPKQLGLPKEGPSSRLPNRTLTGTPEPKGLLPAAKPTPTRSARKVTGAAADVWKQFPKINKPKQLGLPKEGPSSRLPNRTLTGTPEPKGLLPAAKPTPTRSARKGSLRGSGPFRATGPSGGNATLERLAAQAAKPSGGGGKPPSGLKPSSIATAAGAAAATGGLAGDKKKDNQQYNVYNTQDPSGRIRNRLAVGPKIVGPKIVGPKIVGNKTQAAKEFDTAYAKAKQTGGTGSKFKWKDKEYGVY